MTGQTNSKESERRIAVRLPADLWEQVREEANRRDVSMNFLVVRAVTRYLPASTPVEDSTHD